jgi:hypothetical protein
MSPDSGLAGANCLDMLLVLIGTNVPFILGLSGGFPLWCRSPSHQMTVTVLHSHTPNRQTQSFI